MNSELRHEFDKRRQGILRVSPNFIEEGIFPYLFAAMGVSVVRCEYIYLDGLFAYHVVSPFLPVVSQGDIPPEYLTGFEKDENGRVVRWFVHDWYDTDARVIAEGEVGEALLSLMYKDLYKCENCEWIGEESQLNTSSNPTSCPECGQWTFERV